MIGSLRKLEEYLVEYVGEGITFIIMKFRYFCLVVGIIFLTMKYFDSTTYQGGNTYIGLFAFYLIGATFKKYVKWAERGGYKHRYLS